MKFWLAAFPDDFGLLGEIRHEAAGHVFFVKLKKTVEWNEIRLSERAGLGKFLKTEILRIPATEPTKLLVQLFVH
jgi:hypothetical protein